MTPNQVQQKGQSGVSIWTVVSFLLGTALGSGSIWSWQQIKLQAQKQELERVVQTTELRQRELDLDTKIIELTRKYVDSKDAYRKSPSPQINNEILALKSQ